ERYLASGMIRGIGKVTAKRLVAAFGAETLKIIEKDSARLEEVEGIGPHRRRLIKESWNEQKGVRDIMIFLQSHGVGTAQAVRIYRQYGQDAINIIREDPYRLCREVWGIGFKTADKLAMNLGLPRTSGLRARAGIVHVLETLAEEGHCFCNEAELLLKAEVLLEIPVEILAEALTRECESGSLVKEAGRVFLSSLYRAEVFTAEKIRTLLTTPPRFKPIAVEEAVRWAERRIGLTLAPEQSAALRMALSEKVSIITGGPGVGKTTIIRALVEIFGARNLSVVLAAPTGRAAKRMEEATGHEAKTIHRMLKYNPHTGQFEYGQDNPLSDDVFILDEVSMMDVSLMSRFLSALPDWSCLVLVGDVDQLPSVGPGNVLRDLIESSVLPCTRLRTIFRQEAGGAIIRNAHAVNRGEGLELHHESRDSDFYFIETDETEKVIERMLELVTHRIPQRFGFDPMNDIQVLTPMRRNQLGADNLNAILQQALNPTGTEVSRVGKKYRLGDRVMQIRNNYDKEVFNGDIGRIVDIDHETQQLVVDFDGRRVQYDITELDELVHAYACSIHKAQGSEYPAVVILMSTQHYKLLQRNLLYTAITRGRKLVCLIGSRKAVWIAIRNNEIRLRRTALKERLAFGSGANSVVVPE
ncbi:MAG: ATP-dependent RecD-like DNA helicase, partial [Kiritimatiellae bacterium]|nr:ATP-dependent RecD-like DNA helicase [Kiritimatiellia bacterium]